MWNKCCNCIMEYPSLYHVSLALDFSLIIENHGEIDMSLLQPINIILTYTYMLLLCHENIAKLAHLPLCPRVNFYD